MEVKDCILTRRSIKKYLSKEVPLDLLHEIELAGEYAASGKGMQSPIILEITNKEVRDNLSKLNASIMGKTDFDPFYNAPAVLVVLYEKKYPTGIYDGSLVMGNMMLRCHDLGLASCWIHRAKEEFESEYGKMLLKSLGLHGEYEGVGNLIVGYPDMEAICKKRKENYVYKIN